ncbi:LacI family DNA-binding transcriptional regulator [Streptacidiphilus monticola]|uniref:LacI family DNA-binding transcriptional regulator n=1 Tax=Streptacidiphilus monticola TaxID=2161674 RepID=A0ABW1G346_9ACTN
MSGAGRAAGPTLEDVARAAGVSRATVSRVVNGTRNVAPEIQRAVLQAVSAVGYVPNLAARQLITRRSGVVALVMSGGDADDPSGTSGQAEPRSQDAQEARALAEFGAQVFADPFFGRVLTGVLAHLGPRGLHPLLMLARGDASRTQVVSRLRQGAADGALVVSIDPADPLPRRLVQAGLPTVLFARPEQPLRAAYVDLAHQDGGRLAAERLLQRGCRQVGAIAGPLALHAGRARLDGFCDTMARHGHAYVPVAVGNFTQDSGEQAMRELLAQQPDLDGVFAGNDLMAAGALHVLREHGRRVPEDVALVGFDDSGAALSCRPRLTTVRQPVEEMAAQMAALLLETLDAPTAPPRAVLFDPELVVRASG